MPNFKIIQDLPDQARIKIYGSENTALQTVDGGYLAVTAPANGLTVTASAEGLSITGPVNGLIVTASASGLSITGPANGLIVTAPASGLSITGPANGLIVTAPADGFSITGPANGLIVTAPASGLSITGPANGLIVTAPADGFSITGPANGLIVTAPASGLSITGPANGLIVTAPAGGLLITSSGLPVISALSTTDVTEVKTGITNTTYDASDTYEVLGVAEYSFGLVNNSTLVSGAQAVAKLQLSPDGLIWFDNGSAVTLAPQTSSALVSSIFLKYARVYYAAANGASPVDLSIFFQGQTS